MSTKKSPALADRFNLSRVNAPASVEAPPTSVATAPVAVAVAPVAKRARTTRAAATAEKDDKDLKTIPVRLTQQQWYEAKEFGMRYDLSMQVLFVQGINLIRVSKGLPPLSGTELISID